MAAPDLLRLKASLGAHPYIKVGRRYSALPSQHKSIGHPVSEGEIRASTYLALMFGLRGVLRQLLVSDVQCETIPDSNFVALSGSNYKTADILPSRENIFVRVYLMTQTPILRIFT